MDQCIIQCIVYLVNPRRIYSLWIRNRTCIDCGYSFVLHERDMIVALMRFLGISTLLKGTSTNKRMFPWINRGVMITNSNNETNGDKITRTRRCGYCRRGGHPHKRRVLLLVENETRTTTFNGGLFIPRWSWGMCHSNACEMETWITLQRHL